MASNKTIDITAKIANLQKIRDELSKVKVNIKVESKELDSIMKLGAKGLTIPVKLDIQVPAELKELIALSKKGITIKGNTIGTGASASKSTTTNDRANTSRDIANNRANEVLAKEEIAFRQRVNEQHQKNLRNEEYIAAERAKNNRILLDLQREQIRRAQQASKQNAALNGQFSPFVNGVPVGAQSKLDPVYIRRLLNQQKQDAALDGSYSELVNGVRPGSSSRINPNIALRRQREQERILRAQQKAADNLEKANEYVRNNPLDALLGTDTKTIAAKKFGVSRGAITSRANFFDPKRVFKGENFKEILYTTLLGGAGQGLGAAVGAATFDKGGTLIGANVAAATIAVFEKIAGAMTKTVQAGAQYERTVTGITGIFQATSQVIDKEGKPVGIGEALRFQRNRAENIQGAAQRALLPLGISGDAASALTKSFTAGLAQRGIAPDEKTTETVVRRLGAAINTLQPELANDANALQRTVEDIIGGSPQAARTELGAAIKGLAPNLFTGGAKTNEDIVKATDSLEQLVIAIKNNDTASVQWQRALGTLQLAQQEVGRGILEGLAPAMKAIADELAKPELVSGLKELGQAIGEAAGDLIKLLIPAIKGLSQAAKGGVQAGAGLGKIAFGGAKAVTSFAAGNYSGVSEGAGDIFGNLGALLTRRRINLTGADSNPLLPGDTPLVSGEQSSSLGGAFANFANTLRARRGLPPLGQGPANLTTRPSLNSLFSSAKTNFGIEDPSIILQDLSKSPENSLRGLLGLRTKLRDYDSGRSPKDLIEQSIGLNTQEIGFRRQAQQNKNELFDDSEAGQLSRALSEKGSLRDVLKLAEDNVAKRKQLLTIASTATDKQAKDEEAIAKARLGLKQAEEEVIKIRKEALNKEREIAEKRLNILRRAAAAEDSGTVTGRFAGLAKEGKANATEKDLINQRIADAQRILNDPLASAQEKANARSALTEENINKVANASREADRQRRQQREQFNKDTSGLRNNLRIGAFQDSQKSADLNLKQLDISTKELTLEQEKLALATKNANKALDDFSKTAALRELGRQGEEIAAAEAIVAAGGTLPSGVDPSLVRGQEGFDPEARALFEERVARERFGAVSRQNQYERLNDEGAFGDTAKGLRRNIRELALDKERQDLKPEEFAIQRRSILRSKASNALSEEQAALEEYQNDPNNPELKAAYFKAKEAREAVEKEQEDLKSSSSGTLAVPQGPSSSLRLKGSGYIDGEAVPGKASGSSFTIDGQKVTPRLSPEGINISDASRFGSGYSSELLASNDIGGAILSGISGSAYGKARESTAGAKAIGESILNGLGKDRAGRLKEEREKGDRGDSVFDGATASRPPLTQQETTQAFLDALNSAFV